jgi:hypothetical protein
MMNPPFSIPERRGFTERASEGGLAAEVDRSEAREATRIQGRWT